MEETKTEKSCHPIKLQAILGNDCRGRRQWRQRDEIGIVNPNKDRKGWVALLPTPLLPPFSHVKQGNQEIDHSKPNWKKASKQGTPARGKLWIRRREGRGAAERDPCSSSYLLPLLAMTSPGVLGGKPMNPIPSSRVSSVQLREPWCVDMMPSLVWEREDLPCTHPWLL